MGLVFAKTLPEIKKIVYKNRKSVFNLLARTLVCYDVIDQS